MTTLRTRIAAALGGTLAAMLAASAAGASSVVIWPVDPTIKAGAQSTALWIENKGATPITLQVRSFRWGQTADGETLDQQSDILASPPIAEVGPGKRQLVRVIRRVAPVRAEQSYRLMVDELPVPQAGGPTPVARLAVQMRYSIPLFVYASDAKLAPALDTRIQTTAAGRVLAIRNDGAMHARLTDLRVGAGGRETVVRGGLAGYVLPGATLIVPLPVGATGTIRAGVNGADQILAPSA